MNGIMRRELRKKTGFGQSLHNFTKRGSDLGSKADRQLAANLDKLIEKTAQIFTA